MGFFFIFITSAITCLSLLSSGKFFNNTILYKQEKNFFELLIFGIIFLSFLALVINFVFSLNPIFNLVFIIFPIFYYIFFQNKYYKNELIKISIISALVVILISLENTNRPDAGLYHLPFINILNENNLIVGITNLHFRFGHISILQYISAIFNNLIYGSNGILIPPAIFFLSLIGYFFHNLLNKKEDNLIQYFSFVFLSYCLINMNRYSSWGNDDFASILFFICIIETYKLYNNFNLKALSVLTLFCSFAFLIKTFFIITFLMPLYLFLKNYKNIILIKILNPINFFTLFFIFFWLFKNFLNSSCFLFPLEFTCLFGFEWSLTKIAINNISDISEAWAKAFPDYIYKNLNFSEYISNFYWVSTWLDSHFKIILKNILILIPIILIYNFFIKIKISNSQKKFCLEMLVLLIILCTMWFIKFPLLRFGEGFLVTLVTFFFIALNIIKINFINLKKFKIIFISILITVILIKNFVRIYDNFEYKYVDYPWPKKNSYSNENKLIEYTSIINSDEIIYYEPKVENNLCMYGKAPCASIGVNKYFFKNNEMRINKDKFFIFDKFVIINK
tara:strand:+ start:1496 stop:3187 length:1692 start_codon:yes stop_codon:yes gene_type:complete